jgi:hypothetical protein
MQAEEVIMKSGDEKRKHAEVNPAARRDRPGEPHEDLVERGPEARPDPVRPYQEEPLDPLDQGGIGG